MNTEMSAKTKRKVMDKMRMNYARVGEDYRVRL